MRILGFHIDGFGVFHDQGTERLGPGLCLFEGANESGKSTLVEFFRFALFGPAGPRGREYPPLRGGRPGGRLRLETSAGRHWLLERSEAGLLVHPAAGPGFDGDATQPSEALHQEPAHRQAPGLEPSSPEPQDLSDTLPLPVQAEEDHAPGAGTSQPTWMGGLDRRTFERVFAIGLQDLQGLEVLTEEGLRGRLLAAGTGLGDVDLPAVLAALDRRQRSILLLRGKRPSLNFYLQQARDLDREIAELQELPARYEELLARRQMIRRELSEREEELTNTERRLRHLEVLRQAREPWLRWKKAGEEIQRLEREAGEGELDQEAVNQLEREVAELEQQYRSSRARLAHLRERWRTAGGEVHDEELQGDAEPGSGAEVSESADPMEPSEAQLPGEAAHVALNPETLRRRREALGTLRALMQRRQLLEAEARRLQDSLETLEQSQAGLRRQLSRSQAAAPLWALPLVLLLPLLLPFLEPSRGAWLAALGTALGCILIFVGSRRRQRQLSEEHRSDLEAELDQLDQNTLRTSQELLGVHSDLRPLSGEMNRCASRAGWEVPETEIDLERLAGELDDQAATLEIRREVELRLGQERAGGEALEQQLEDRRSELEALLAAAGAGSPSDYRRRAEQRRRLTDLRRQQEDLRLGLDALLGEGAAGQRLEVQLEGSNPTALKDEEAVLEDRRRVLRERLDGARQELGSLATEIEHLGQEERLGEALLERQVLRRRIAGETRRWATAALARGLLEEARETYEERRQPRVLKRAADLLATMTDGRYRLLPCAETGGVQLEDRRLGRKGEAAWSSALADQVYLALRLALAEELGQHQEPLPLILDDILVRCDPPRQQATARVLAQLATRRQLLFFTCHPDSRRALERAAREAHAEVAVYRVEDGVLSPGDGNPNSWPAN
jgi:uncharacterized protein YhaN